MAATLDKRQLKSWDDNWKIYTYHTSNLAELAHRMQLPLERSWDLLTILRDHQPESKLAHLLLILDWGPQTSGPWA